MTIQQLSLYSLLLTNLFIQGSQDPIPLKQQKDEAFKKTSDAFYESRRILTQIIQETPEGKQLALLCYSNSDTFDPQMCQKARFQLANTDRYKQEYVPASDKFRDLSKTFEKTCK